jgi:tRNA(adenine34) deaminase
MVKSRDQYCMQEALKQAKLALDKGDFPVGCVISDEGKIIAKGARMGTSNGGTNEIDHAEIVALRQLNEKGGNSDFKFSKLTLYSTLEPCLMCFGAILISAIERVVYAYEDVMGGGTKIRLNDMAPLYRNHKIEVVPFVLRKESLILLQQFFQNPKNYYWNDSLLSNYTLLQRPMEGSI